MGNTALKAEPAHRTTETTVIIGNEASLGSLRAGWWKLFALGVAVTTLGIMTISLPLAGTMAIQNLLAVTCILVGLVQCAHVYSSRSSLDATGSLFSGIVYLALGLSLMLFPAFGAITLTFILGALFFIEAVVIMRFAWMLKNLEGRSWLFFSGAASLILAGLIIAGLPGTAAWALGLMLGVNLLSTGLGLVMFSFAIK